MGTNSSSPLVVPAYGAIKVGWDIHTWWGADVAQWMLSFMQTNDWGNVYWICKWLLSVVLLIKCYSKTLRQEGTAEVMYGPRRRWGNKEVQEEGALGIQGGECHGSSGQVGDQAQTCKSKAGYKTAFGGYYTV